MNLILLGAPGSGKGTQAARLAKRGGLRHISSGELLREAVAAGTEIGKQVEARMNAGQLVDDATVLKLIIEAFDNLGDCAGWILDGYPRNADQAEVLEDVLSRNRDVVEALIVLDVDADVVVERLSKRGREDDTPDTVRRRIEVYIKETAPVIDFYELRYDVHRVDGSKTIEEVTDEAAGLVGL